jgi:hypothetical protein
MRKAFIDRVCDELSVLLLFGKMGMRADGTGKISIGIRLEFDEATEQIPQLTHSII